MSPREVRFNDLTPTSESLAREIEEAIARVVASSWFVLGPEVEAFEEELASAMGVAHAVGVASGTDGLSLSLLAAGVEPGDEVVTSPMSAAFTALAVSRIGARPVFADVEADTLTLSAASVAGRIGPKTRAIVPVHLYGNACDMESLEALVTEHSLVLVEDACQAHGARLGGRPLGGIGRAGALSFYPTKNLGALGDGGAVLTNDDALAAKVRRLRNGGQSSRYTHEEVGFNSRLDELQAAVLRAKLPHLDRWNRRRRELAARYESGLAAAGVGFVTARNREESARHLFVVKTKNRDETMGKLKASGVQTLVHYPVPTHRQPAYRALGGAPGDCPVAESAADEILSLPLHPNLTDADADYVLERLIEL